MSTNAYDQFFTKKEVATKCYDIFNKVMNECLGLQEEIYYIEPSAGNCDFFYLLPQEKRIGIDIDPPESLKNKVLLKEDFLTWDYYPPNYSKSKVVVIGNPPFGKKGNLAFKFINKASNIADTFAFILPILFSKYLTQKNIPKDFSLIYDKKLPANGFYLKDKKEYTINTTFQIWTRLKLKNGYKDMRIKEAPPTKHPDIDIWQYNATKAAEKVFNNDFDFAVLRQGYQGFDKIKYNADDCDRKKQWILFKAHTKKAKTILKNIDFVKLAEKNTTAAKGFGKADVIAEYMRLKQVI